MTLVRRRSSSKLRLIRLVVRQKMRAGPAGAVRQERVQVLHEAGHRGREPTGEPVHEFGAAVRPASGVAASRTARRCAARRRGSRSEGE